MNKIVRRILIAVVFLIVIAIFGAVVIYSSKTWYNDENVIGNTAGNILNGGLFCENDGRIYFSNPYDDGNLYSMDLYCTDYELVYPDNASYINVAGKYIIYARDNHHRKGNTGNFLNLNSVGLFRIKRDGSDIKQLYNYACGSVTQKGNYVYYQHYDTDDGLQLYKVKIDATENQLLDKEDVLPASFVGDRMYFTGVDDDHNMYSMSVNGQRSLIRPGNFYHLLVSNNQMYYLDLEDNYTLYRCSMDGSNPQKLVNERCSFFNISTDGNYLIYQIDGGDHNRLCAMDLSSGEAHDILEGDFNSIYTTSSYIFFKEFESKKIYKMPTTSLSSRDGSSVSIFEPEVLSK
ncbi:MAG: DUF5050 domain-containing protein [Lachnospiraceae bacterium]|nr:DUF5050 domain-containing protein [Lachnospiraceae bacterium]